MDLQTTQTVAALVGSLLAIVIGLITAWVKWGLPKQRLNAAANTAILGRPEVKDRSGAVIQPAEPGMVAQVATLTETLRELVDDRFHNLERRVNEHDDWIAAHDKKGPA